MVLIVYIRREPGKNGKILSDHRQDGNVAAGVIGKSEHVEAHRP